MAGWAAVAHFTLVGITAVFALGVPLKISLPRARRARGTPTAVYLRWVATAAVMFFAALTAMNIFLRSWDFAAIDAASAALYAYMWWISGGGDSMRRLRDRIRSGIRRIGARLAVAPVPG